MSPASVMLGAAISLTAPSSNRAPAFVIYNSIFSSANGDSQLQRWSSLIGIVTAIVGNILISFALNIQRYAHIRLHEQRARRKGEAKAAMKNSQGGYGTVSTNGQDADGENDADSGGEDDPLRRSFQSIDSQSSSYSERRENYLKSPYWWGGIFLMTIGEAGNFLAYGFAPASIVSPLGVVALISNCVIAPIMLKERFRLRDFWGVVIAVGGAVTVVLSAKNEEKKLGPHEIWESITTLEFEVYMAVTIALIAVLMWASPKYGSRTILIDLGLVGLFGGYTALSTKGVASMLSSTLWRALTTPVTYVLVAVLVGTAIMQVRYVNKALQRFDSTQVIPVQFVMFTLSVIIGSAVLYRDFEKATAENVEKFIGGCLLTFFGVFLITSGRDRNQDEDEEEDVAEEVQEQRIRLADQEPSGEEAMQQEVEQNLGSVRSRRSKAENHETPPESRRSSKVSFADRPWTPRVQSNSSYTPRIPTTLPTSDGAEETPLLDNPWRSAESLAVTRHPGLPNSISSPVLPSEAQSPSTNLLLRPGGPDRASSQGNVHTHPSQQQSPAPPQAERPVTPATRHSIAHLIPGPYISPLSGGLSAVVADTLRRGVDSPGRKLKRLTSRRRLRSGSQNLVPRTADGSREELSGTSPTGAEDQISKSLGTDREGEWSAVTRTRSLSNTLGDFLRGMRKRDGGGDEEAGPSGS